MFGKKVIFAVSSV